MENHLRPIIVVAAGAALFVMSSGSSAAPSPCAARDSETLLQNSKVRVYSVPTRAPRRNFEVIACLKATGDGSYLGFAEGQEYPFLRPAIALAGPVVGYATESTDEETFGTSIRAVDMRHPNDVKGNLNGSYGAPPPHHLVKVGSLRVTRGGTLVWIACPERQRAKVSGSRKPNCVRPGDRDDVYLSRPGKALKRLDRSRRIHPGSLRMKEGKVSWLHGRHRRYKSVG